MKNKITELSLMLKPSSINGIGVFAVHDIAKNTQFVYCDFVMRKLLIKDVPKEFIHYCILMNDTECLAPERFDRMEVGWYLNHSDKANIKKISEKDVIAIEDIKAGEEILMNYNELNEPEHLKQTYYATTEK